LSTYIGLLRDDLATHLDNYNAVEKAFVRTLPDDPKPAILLKWILNIEIRRSANDRL
jgi:hypothetical protein